MRRADENVDPTSWVVAGHGAAAEVIENTSFALVEEVAVFVVVYADAVVDELM